MKKSMTSRERLLTAIRHEEPDLVPNSPRIHAFLAEYYRDAQKGLLDAAKEFDFDPIVVTGPGLSNYISSPYGSYKELGNVSVELNEEKVGDCTKIYRHIKTPAGTLTDGFLIAPSFGEYGVSPNPHRFEYAVKKPADAEKIRYLLPDPTQANMNHYLNLVQNVGEHGLVEVRPTIGADHYLVDSLGQTNAMVAYYEDREMLTELLCLFHSYNQAVTKVCLEAGTEVIFDSWYNCSMSAGWSPQIYKEIFLPLIKENVELTHSYGALYHFYDDGKCMAIIEWLRDCGIDIISTLPPPPIGDVDLALVKEKIGDAVCLKGNIDLIHVLLKGTPELVREKVKEAIRIAAPGGGFILSTSDSIRDGTPLENVRAYFEAAREYGMRKT